MISSTTPASTPATLQPVEARNRARWLDLDRAKGLGIFLVVVGHLGAKSRPEGNAWFGYLQTGLYQFHMPFFMYLSGFVCYLSGAARTTRQAWTGLAGRRVYRLLVPFVIFGLALIAGKLLAARFMHVDNAPTSLGTSLFGMLWDTDNSPAISVWYIAVVFVLTVITPPILWSTGNRTRPLLLIAGIVYLLPVPHVMYLDRVARYFLFFSLGGAAADAGKSWLDLVDRYIWVSIAMFALLLYVALAAFDSIPESVRLLACGVASMPALHGLVRRPILSQSPALLTLGSMTFVIYLLNTPFIGLMKGLLLKFMPWDGNHFLVFFPLLIAAGTLGPILIKRYIFRLIPPLDRITD